MAAEEVLPETFLSKLLTIAIPTYNRASHLATLLAELARQWPAQSADIDVFISNNASTDATEQVIAAFVDEWPDAIARTNVENLGADRNIAACFIQATSRYVWILGDDDLPSAGALAQIVDILRDAAPDLMYLHAIPMAAGATDAACDRVANARYRLLGKERFSTLVNVNLTFISAVLINKSLVVRQVEDQASIAGRLMGTSLVQLSWVLEALRLGTRFVHVDDALLRSTTANSGGYAVLSVFCVNHTKAVLDCLSSMPALAEKILSRTFTGYLPGLIWNVRRSKIGSFDLPPPHEIVDPVMTSRWQYWLFLLPIWTTPLWCAWTFLQFSKVIRKVVWTLDALGSRKVPTRQSLSEERP